MLWCLRCKGVLEQVLPGVFVNGLRLNIQAKVQMVVPQGLEDLIEFTQQVED